MKKLLLGLMSIVVISSFSISSVSASNLNLQGEKVASTNQSGATTLSNDQLARHGHRGGYSGYYYTPYYNSYYYPYGGYYSYPYDYYSPGASFFFGF